MEWSEENMIKLIDAYRAKSLLWDPHHKDHFKKPLKADAWREIEAEINITADQCKKKMISLLSSYRRERGKIKSSQGTGKGRDEIYVTRWFAYEALKFLEDRDVPRKGLTTETDMSENVEDIGAEVNLSAQSQQETPAASSTNRPSKRAKKTDDPNSSMMDSAFNILKNAAEKLNTETVKPDEIDSFFTYVAAKVKKYTAETQTSVQHAVFEILMKADKGYYNWAAPNYQHSNNWQNNLENVPPNEHSNNWHSPPNNIPPSESPAAQSQQYVLQPVNLNRIPAPIQSPSTSLTNMSSQPSPSESIMSEHFSDFV